MEISMECVSQGLNDNNVSSVQLMAWCQNGNTLLSEPMTISFPDTFMRHSAAMPYIFVKCIQDIGHHIMT